MAFGSLTYEVPPARRWHTFIAGLAIDVVGLLLVIAVGSHLSNRVEPQPIANNYHVTLIAPATIAPANEAAVHPTVSRQLSIPVEVAAKPEAPMLQTPKLPPIAPPTPAERIRAMQLQIQPQRPELPKPDFRKHDPPQIAAFAVPNAPTPPKPSKEIKTDVLDAPKSETATVSQRSREVQTGGFGDPSGVGGQGAPQRSTVTVASLGSFDLPDLPSGPGKGNGGAGIRGASGTIRSTGFGDGVASTAPHARGIGSVMPSGFGNVIVAGSDPSPQRIQKKSDLQPVEIVYKPRPAYTAEARQLRLEGEVLLEVVFAASGSLHVNRVVKGLGHGLDDSALAAAQRIQFHPARRDGQPYDCAALVHMVFELAD